MADIVFHRLKYQWRLDQAGVMPCLHVACVRNGTAGTGPRSFSSGGSDELISFEHHAIFDRDRSEYIHVSFTDDNEEMRVIRTGRRAVEMRSSHSLRVVKQPRTVQEAREILHRARNWVDNGTWEYDVLWHNCEHFVNECWNPQQPARSAQAQTAVASLGGSSAVGAVGAGTTGGIVAATIQPIATVVTTTATNTNYLLGFIPWGTVTTSTSATVMTGLPVGAVIGIAAAGTVVGAGLLGSIAYGIRELVFDHTARNAQLVPIAIKNNSRQTITASLRNADDTLSTWSDALYSWRALIGVGIMSVDIQGDIAEELNPPTVSDSGSTEFVLTISSNHDLDLTCMVSRGDVVTFDGQTLRKEEADLDDLLCKICFGRPANCLVLPCEHHDFCDQCVGEWRRESPTCPQCRGNIEEVDVARNIWYDSKDY